MRRAMPQRSLVASIDELHAGVMAPTLLHAGITMAEGSPQSRVLNAVYLLAHMAVRGATVLCW